MINIHSDVYITRRQRLHFILNEDSQRLATHQTLEQCFDWMIENGYTEANVWGALWVWHVRLKKAADKADLPPWLEPQDPLAGD